MLSLYKVRFNRPDGRGQFQDILVSERNKRAAVARARSFLFTNHYQGGKSKLDSIERICSTPDDVLDWA